MELREKVSNLRGVLVVAYEEGLQLGKVFDIYIEKQTKQIKGISFKTGLLRIEKESFVSVENIRKMGKDVVIITNEAAATPLPIELEGSSLKALKGFKITTHDGKHLGEFSDLKVTMGNGKISGIILSGNKMLDIKVADITIGADVIMVPADYAARVKEIEQQKASFLTRMFSTATVSEMVKETVKETVEKVGEKVGQVLKKSKSGIEKVEEKLEQKEPEAKKVEVQPEKSDHEGKSEDKRTVEQ